jgi:hypothetical protein
MAKFDPKAFEELQKRNRQKMQDAATMPSPPPPIKTGQQALSSMTKKAPKPNITGVRTRRKDWEQF